MDNNIKLTTRSICTQKKVFEDSIEQSIEKDFVLPDYNPDIFKILKCSVTPSADSHSINGGRLSFEVSALVRVWYLSESDHKLCCIEQTLSYSKSCDIDDDVIDPDVVLDTHCDYVNCRVVNSRRLDIRGAMTVKICVTGTVNSEVVTDASGGGLEIRKTSLSLPVKRLTAAKRITLIEELELSTSKPPIDSVLRSDCRITRREHKMIAGKLITKGDADITLLYCGKDAQGEQNVESMTFSLPFSQIIDIDGIDDTFNADVDIRCTQCDIIPKSEDSSCAECEIVLSVRCTAVKYENAEAVTDAFSTKYETELEYVEISGKDSAGSVCENAEVHTSVSKPDEGIACVYDCRAECSDVSSRYDKESGKLTVSGNVTFGILGRNTDGTPVYIEKDAPFETSLESSEEGREICAEISSCSCRLTSESSADADAVITIRAAATAAASKKALCDITADMSTAEERSESFCVKVCRCDDTSDIWSAAKKHRTTVAAITESNDLTDGGPAGDILIIPLSCG